MVDGVADVTKRYPHMTVAHLLREFVTAVWLRLKMVERRRRMRHGHVLNASAITEYEALVGERLGFDQSLLPSSAHG